MNWCCEDLILFSEYEIERNEEQKMRKYCNSGGVRGTRRSKRRGGEERNM